jgi:hypothetical protein
MVTTGFSEEATAAALPPLLPRGPGQNDAGAPAFLAWGRTAAAGDALDACLALLLATSAQLLSSARRRPAVPLRERYERVAEICPVATHPYGDGVSRLTTSLSDEIHPAEPASR